jgi:hypothetical protein
MGARWTAFLTLGKIIPDKIETFKFEFPAACWSEAEIPPTGVGAKWRFIRLWRIPTFGAARDEFK